VVQRFAALLSLPENQAAMLALFADGTRDPLLRQRIRDSIVDPQKRLVHRGRANAQARGELPADTDEATARQEVDIIFDTIAGAVEHRILVSGEPAGDEWISRLTTLILAPLAAFSTARR
jgi:hypothetical protein